MSSNYHAANKMYPLLSAPYVDSEKATVLPPLRTFCCCLVDRNTV